jgi:hypothetical protein
MSPNSWVWSKNVRDELERHLPNGTTVLSQKCGKRQNINDIAQVTGSVDIELY